MKKIFTAVTTLTLVVFLISAGLVLADDTRAQFERSSRNKATSGLFKDAWDNFIDYPWFAGQLEKGNYLWTNLANLQSDNLPNDVNTGYQATNSWAKDEKENILGRPGWDTNNSYALGYLGNPVGSEGWNVGIVYNYQTFDNKTTTDGHQDVANGFTETSNMNKHEMLEHHWLLGGGFSVSDQLKLGLSWYHTYNDQKLESSIDSYSKFNDGTYQTSENDSNYKLIDQVETLSFGAYFQLSDDLSTDGYLDIDYNHAKINQDTSVVALATNYASITETEGSRNDTFYGNEDRKDFGFDILSRTTKMWNSDFWKKTSFYIWLGYHPQDGDYTGSQDSRNYNGSSWNYHKAYDVDGDVNWDTFNWGLEARSYVDFGERVHFAWSLVFNWYDVEQTYNYDWVTNPGDNSSTTSIEDGVDYRSYNWSFPVALEIDFVKNLTGRLGARWNLADYKGDTKTSQGYTTGNPESYPTTYENSEKITTDSKTSSTSYSFGLGWRFNEYLQIDLTDFTDLTDMNDWQLSCTLMW
jgi:hypothetical protein